MYYTNARYTSKVAQGIFNAAEHLLTPAFIMLFVVIAVKLIKTPGLFEQKD